MRIRVEPTPEEVARETKKREREAVRLNPLWLAIKDKDVAQIDAWIQANIQDINDVKRALAFIIAKLVHD